MKFECSNFTLKYEYKIIFSSECIAMTLANHAYSLTHKPTAYTDSIATCITQELDSWTALSCVYVAHGMKPDLQSVNVYHV